MIFERIISSHSLYLTLSVMFVSGFVINWIAVQRSSSAFSILWSLIPYLLIAAYIYRLILSNECVPIEACEWSTLGYILSLFVYSASAVLQLVLAFRIRALFRARLVAETLPPRTIVSDLKEAGILLASTLMGLVVAISIVLIGRSGIFTSWRQVEIPADIPARVGAPLQMAGSYADSEKVHQILHVSQTGLHLYTDRERVLSVRFPGPYPGEDEQEIWYVEAGPPEVDTQENGSGCPVQLIVLPPPEQVQERVRSLHCDDYDLLHAEYAILEGGSLWAWQQVIHLYDFLRLAMVAGPLGGLLLAQAYLLRPDDEETSTQQNGYENQESKRDGDSS